MRRNVRERSKATQRAIAAGAGMALGAGGSPSPTTRSGTAEEQAGCDHFVYEYQDTSPKTIRLLLGHLAGAGRQSCVVGLFGDSMQKIYATGQGAVLHSKLTVITKHENYRCSPPVVVSLNEICPELQQEGVGEHTDGEVHFFLNLALPTGQASLDAARRQLAELGWSDDTTSYLMLTHRGIAGSLSYGALLQQYQILGSRGRDRCPYRDQQHDNSICQRWRYGSGVEGRPGRGRRGDLAERGARPATRPG